MDRVTLKRAANQARSTHGRATIRSVEDKHLMQEVAEADAFHSETISNKGAPFERWQMVGFTAVPLKQFDEDNQQKQSQSNDGFNNNQPKGKSAEALVLYLNGHRSHPVAMIDDRRVRPYNMKPGDAALYHASGTEQKAYMSDDGAFLVSNNNASEEKNAQTKERFASLRHVNLAKQKHEIKKGDQVADHKHEGDTVNAEVRCTSNRIEFRVGDTVVGYYDKNAQRWSFTGEMRLGDDSASNPVYGVAGSGKTTKTSGVGAVLVKATEPGPPTSLDTAP